MSDNKQKTPVLAIRKRNWKGLILLISGIFFALLLVANPTLMVVAADSPVTVGVKEGDSHELELKKIKVLDKEKNEIVEYIRTSTSDGKPVNMTTGTRIEFTITEITNEEIKLKTTTVYKDINGTTIEDESNGTISRTEGEMAFSGDVSSRELITTNKSLL